MKIVLKETGRELCPWFFRLRRGSSGQPLWKRYWNVGFHEVRGNSAISEVLLGSIEDFVAWTWLGS